MTNKEGQRVNIVWRDAVIYKHRYLDEALHEMETVGYVAKETEDYIIISNPVTRNIKDNVKHPSKSPTFYFIPKKMIQNIDKLTS